MKRTLILSLLALVLFINPSISQEYIVKVREKGTNRFSYLNLNGEKVLSTDFYRCSDFSSEGKALVIKSPKERYLLVDINGKVIPTNINLQPFVNNFKNAIFPIKDGMIRTRVGNKVGAINTKGKLTVPVIYTHLSEFNANYATAKIRKEYYIVHKNGNATKINTMQLSHITPFSEGLAGIRSNLDYGFVDTLGNIQIEPQFAKVGYFTDGIAWARDHNGFIGFINRSGEWLVQPSFLSVGKNIDGITSVKTSQKLVGYIQNDGTWLIEPQYLVGKAFDPESGLALVKSSSNGWGYINKKGEFSNFDYIGRFYNFNEGMAIIRADEYFGFMDKTGKWVIQPRFITVGKFINGFARAELETNWGLIDKKGSWVIEPKYGFISDVMQVDIP